MVEFTSYFIASQILVFIAMGFDFLSFQYKKREHTILCFIISAALISAHYFLLNKFAAGVIIFFSVLRFATSYFTTNKKYLILFILLNTVALFFTFKEGYDLIIYVGALTIMIGNFQNDNRMMRKMMMVGTSIIIVYNFIIFSPMGVIVETSFLISNFIGYYRHYIRK